ncbi:hypothetical protein CQW23_01834 [Capsicum baccatum]|uniref:Xylanase inhibitor N-terminal domain-containing protein n=1 Tax=Capsicum baccatum TaxID=33114 RepID=A0A2G2XQ43_CAPBA|nr:hypothetical protein CQW23_01834 [Capsicum baccatum]
MDCDKGYKSSTYKPVVCNSMQCSFSRSPDCGDCLFKPQPQPRCNNNTCFTFGDNPLIDWFDNSGEVEEDVLAVGFTPDVRVTWPGFIFTCMLRRDMVRLFANGVTVPLFSNSSRGESFSIEDMIVSFQFILVV